MDAVVAAVGEVPREISPDELDAMVRSYFARAEDADLADREPSELAFLIRHHLALGARRGPSEDIIRIVTPHATEEWSGKGSTVVQIVTDDRPFLLDTVAMALDRQGWSIRVILHPQFRVVRDEEGTLIDLAERASGSAGMPEAWMTFEAYSPLGVSAAGLAPALEVAIREGLGAVRVAVADWPAMLARVEACVEILEGTAQPISPQRVGRVTSLLRWLADDHFAFLGYREYTVEGDVFTAVPGSGLGILRGDEPGPEFHAVPRPEDPEVLVFTKDSRRSPVHRPAHLDYIGVREYDRSGAVVRERRFLGLLSLSAYTESVTRIPLLSHKAARLAELSGFDPASHSGKSFQQVVSTYPRDELFEASTQELFSIIDKVAGLQERRQVRLFIRPGRYGRFLSCTVYLPRDRYNTTVRNRIQQTLLESLGGESLEYQATVTESVLARLFFVVRLPEGAPVPSFDVEALERRLAEVSRSWDDRFNDEASTLDSEERGVEFGEGYEAVFTPRQARQDLLLANELASPDDLRFALYSPEDPEDAADLRFKVICRRPMSLGDAIPHFDGLDVDVVDERPFLWELRGNAVYVYDFGFRLPAGQMAEDWTPADRVRFSEAFEASYRGLCHHGKMNRLVLSAGLTWRQIVWLRAIARYLNQAGIPFSQSYVAAALNAHPAIAADLVAAFEAKFNPATGLDPAARLAAFEQAADRVTTALDAVTSLDEDRIVRMFLTVLRGMVRTNAFAADAPALAFKLLPRQIDLLPEPRPAFEIFVYSPRVLGVHLRFGAVARGGLRWSDRREDFRTEVLGLVKAQMVKNTVIVPVGAKGGFVPQSLPDPTVDRQAWLDEGIACYRIFIGSLLSVTDNIVDGAIVPPPDVVRHDSDDPYLVVAADKGTATFSDIANAISVERGFWLGDAFASGGSAGYDHKGMGITARGAWESVMRHFFEMGVDCQTEDFTCVGIGDMAGDVFGNGMLLSEHIRLVAAFNHLHIFLDPNPDAASSFAERQRLFSLPRSAWTDYEASLISAGGGVFERRAKSIAISPEIRAALGIADDVASMTPTELVNAILKAPVDLLWNGGIGTYVKASDESHQEVGDKANDPVRVNGSEVRARCAGEGGNLGWTQRGRIEYALHGGRVNTDFIDNSAGVDTSDHEVNIKILLQPAVRSGALTLPQRNELLASMTDEVAQLVLAHNIDQNLALANSTVRAAEAAAAHEAWMRALEESGHLDRRIESMPSTDEMTARIGHGRGLTRPEMATLLAYTKIRLDELVRDSDLPDDPYLADRLVTYFPRALREEYAGPMRGHRLAREIITTVTVNRFVNSQGISAYHRLSQETGADVGAIVRAQLAARTILSVATDEIELGRMKVDAATDTAVRINLQRMVERVTRWLLHNRCSGIDIRKEATAFTGPVAEVRARLSELLTPLQESRRVARVDQLVAAGVNPELAERATMARYVHNLMPVVETSQRTGRALMLSADVYSRLAQQLGLDQVSERVAALPQTTRWEAMARSALRDDLAALHADLTAAALGAAPEASGADEVIGAWLDGVRGARAETELLAQITDGPVDLARMSVALRTVRSLLG